MNQKQYHQIEIFINNQTVYLGVDATFVKYPALVETAYNSVTRSGDIALGSIGDIPQIATYQEVLSKISSDAIVGQADYTHKRYIFDKDDCNEIHASWARPTDAVEIDGVLWPIVSTILGKAAIIKDNQFVEIELPRTVYRKQRLWSLL